ncbi:hypothetical protein SAMN05444354_13328 [Stigmatella aurantiaca]|uniref:Uncharacterized protein n=1 Tax=Stigmatella aurantiaca TaxID=41 RepID=A0A1H8EHX6_STIAU|nr:hypothetical protein [Stigmatella aurantiaca]SEN19016.1 hypothetical protein SAMN05444354_13328 [Stigmatella aurantiaca]
MTLQRVNMFVESEPGRTASGVINGLIQEELKSLGMDVTSYYKHHLGRSDMLMPVATTARTVQLKGTPPADLAVYCDQGLWIRSPGPAIAKKTMVVFHGLIGGQSLWLDNPAVNQYCTYSRYMREVLVSLLTMPDVRRRDCLDPQGFYKVSNFAAGLPCVANSNGDARMLGSELPEQIVRSVEAGDVLGHALQPRKPDWYAVLNILVHLNLMSREEGGPRYRLVVDAEDFALIDYSFSHGFPFDMAGPRSLLDALGMTVGELLIPVRFLNQAALFQFFKLMKFGLSYNIYPEPFGFYPLESIFYGCPVYTNGIGNNRFNLPPGHGMRVIESVDMAFGDPAAFQEVAKTIIQDVRSRDTVTQECARGREYVQGHFRREDFSRTWQACLARISQPLPEAEPFESLHVQRSPMVRQIDEETGRVVSDFERLTLEPRELGIVREAVGRPMGEVLNGLRDADVDLLQGLFSRAVLTLRPKDYDMGL